jgi:nicotinamide phosphoribosyltransferase
MMLNSNIILLTDSYKESPHAEQYPPGTTQVRSYFAPRVGARWDEYIPFGLQGQLKHYFTTPITKDNIDEAESYFVPHMGGFARKLWEHVLAAHGGYLPLRIRAVPEGTPMPVGVPTITVEATCPDCFWLVNNRETLLVQTWDPSTVATQSREMKRIILRALQRSGSPERIYYKLHDFGCRGVSCMEEAAIAGAAHLVNFRGTDTVPALQYCRLYYGEHMAGHSIPASEHSTICSWGQAHEVDAMRNMIKKYGDRALYACVSDSFDVLNACKNYWGGVLKQAVLEAPGTLVVRPDSGDPTQIVPAVIDTLWQAFGGEVNHKGYRVLHPKVSVIQGDGIKVNTLDPILESVMSAGFSIDSLAFGSDGGLLRNVDRDTMRCAFKGSEVEVNGEIRPILKDPITDPSKKSLSGNLGVYQDLWGKIYHAPYKKGEPGLILEDVFLNGELLRDESLSVIRERADIGVEDL